MKLYSLAFLAMTFSLGAFAGHDPYEPPKQECPSPCPSPCATCPECPAAAPCPSICTSPCELSHGSVGKANGSNYLYNGGNIGTMGSVAGDTGIGLVFSPVDHLAAGLGVGVKYNDANDGHWRWSINAGLEYMVVDSCPFAMGPGVKGTVNFIDDEYQNATVFAGWNFWYTPFNAPLSVGTSLGVNVNFATDAVSPFDNYVSVNLATPGLKLLYLFN